jgi:hypothetical protein
MRVMFMIVVLDRRFAISLTLEAILLPSPTAGTCTIIRGFFRIERRPAAPPDVGAAHRPFGARLIPRYKTIPQRS